MNTLQFTIAQDNNGFTVRTRAYKDGLPLFEDSNGRALCTANTYEDAIIQARKAVIAHNNCTKINPYKNPNLHGG